MSTVSQKNRSIERPFCIFETERKLVLFFVYDFVCLNPRYEQIQSAALNEMQGDKTLLVSKCKKGKATLHKKAPVKNKGFLT